MRDWDVKLEMRICPSQKGILNTLSSETGVAQIGIGTGALPICPSLVHFFATLGRFPT
jgi:hypothetical protein